MYKMVSRIGKWKSQPLSVKAYNSNKAAVTAKRTTPPACILQVLPAPVNGSVDAVAMPEPPVVLPLDELPPPVEFDADIWVKFPQANLVALELWTTKDRLPKKYGLLGSVERYGSV